MASTDEELLSAIRAGGRAAERALDEVYLTQRAAIIAWVQKHRGTREEGKDVLQDAVIALYENVRADRFRGESRIGTYLFSIARFIWLNRLKQKKRRPASEALPSSEMAEPPMPEGLLEREKEQRFRELFGRLGADCRRVLMDSLYHGWDMHTIAQRMGYDSEQVARNKKYRCLQRLKAHLREHPQLWRHFKQEQ